MTVNITKDQAKTIVTELLAKAHNRFKQELAGENEEFLDRVVRQYRAKVARYSWKASQKWCKWNEDGPVLMPDYTRLYYRKGNTEVLVLEYPPQVRLMRFTGSLAKRDSSTSEIKEGEFNTVYQYSLALPYVVFIFKYVNGVFTDVRCTSPTGPSSGWRRDRCDLTCRTSTPPCRSVSGVISTASSCSRTISSSSPPSC